VKALLALVLTVASGCDDVPAASPPSELTFLPAEYEPVAEVLVAWDSDPTLETFFAEFVTFASYEAPVTILLGKDQSPERVLDVATEFGADSSMLRAVEADVSSVWVRDYGPLVVRTGETRKVVDMEYFGDLGDDSAPKYMADQAWHLPTVDLAVEMEGGNLLSDGAGLCLTTETIFEENSHRLSVREIRNQLRHALGCRDLIVLASMVGEPTGHVDMFVTLTEPGEAIVGQIPEGDNENALLLDENATRLERAGLRVRRVPMPGHADGLFRSYTNALAINDIVIVPVYPEDEQFEEQALRVFAEAYSGRTIVPIVASDIIKSAGAVHCVGMTVAK
jgi:agmatine/peptidylarginine deiminase